MAAAATAIKLSTAQNYKLVVVTLTGGALASGAAGNTLIFTEGLPFGSAHIVLTSGTAVTSVQLAVGNDGLTANLVPIGLAMTTLPAFVDITSGVNMTNQAAAQTLAATPHLYHTWVIVGGDSTSVVTITECYMGTRG